MLAAKRVLLCCLLVLILGTAQFVLGDSDKKGNPSDEKDNNGKGSKTTPSSNVNRDTPEFSEPGPSRVKRGSVNITNQWDKQGLIPYVYDPSYNSSKWIGNLERSMRWVSRFVCVSFVDVTNTINKSDPNWLVKNGFDYNSYQLIIDEPSCSAWMGTKNGSRDFKPCYDPQINVHELMHLTGGRHEHQMRISINNAVVNPENVLSSKLSSYQSQPDPPNEIAYDCLSRMVYTRNTFSRNGLETWNFIRDDCYTGEASYSNDLAAYIDLNVALNCGPRYCPWPGPNCNYGYYMRYKGVCQCMCPPDYDPATNCATMLNGPNTGASWPQLPVAVLGGGAGISCPLGFQSGYVNITGAYGMLSSPAAPLPVLQTANSVTIYPICTYNGSVDGSNDWSEWPLAGWFCIPKPNIPCGSVYNEYWITINSTAPVTSSGNIGDTVINGNFVTLKFCCKNQEYTNIFLDLPNGVPFRFHQTGGMCPQVRGMREYIQTLTMYVSNTVANGTAAVPAPLTTIFSSQLFLYECVYLPLTYGCNQDITFNSTYKTVTITTPGFGSTRPTLTRCFYVFRAPAYSRIVVTFTTCDIDPNDKLLVKKYNRFQEPLRIYCQNTSFQVVSEGSYLHVEIQTSYQPASRTGIQFTATVVLPEDNCFNAATGGDDYALDAAVTETYEDCVNWKDCTACDRFPTLGMSGNWALLSDNKCRNPEGNMIYPWCFTHQNGSSCMIRFCDPNNLMNVTDSHSDCPTLVQQDPTFCNDSLQHGMCLKSCNYAKPSTTRATCTSPIIPSDGTLASTPKGSYLQGERAYVNCTANPSQTPMEMLCTASGWTSLTTACTGTSCVDAISTSLCETLMTNFPQYCVANKTKTAAVLSCKKSCGACTSNPACTAPTSPSYTSLNSSVPAGRVMMFSCNANLFLVSGNLIRACASSGSLLGSEPVCQATPLPTDVNINAVRSRLNSIPKNVAYLMNFPYTRVPFNGFVDRLYFYCTATGNFTVFFARVNSTGGYTPVGSLLVLCNYIKWRWTYKIPGPQQIPVSQGDIPGIYSSSAVLRASDCTGYSEQISKCPSMSATSFSQVNNSMSFTGTTCTMTSFGYRVNPKANSSDSSSSSSPSPTSSSSSPSPTSSSSSPSPMSSSPSPSSSSSSPSPSSSSSPSPSSSSPSPSSSSSSPPSSSSSSSPSPTSSSSSPSPTSSSSSPSSSSSSSPSPTSSSLSPSSSSSSPSPSSSSPSPSSSSSSPLSSSSSSSPSPTSSSSSPSPTSSSPSPSSSSSSFLDAIGGVFGGKQARKGKT